MYRKTNVTYSYFLYIKRATYFLSDRRRSKSNQTKKNERQKSPHKKTKITKIYTRNSMHKKKSRKTQDTKHPKKKDARNRPHNARYPQERF